MSKSDLAEQRLSCRADEIELRLDPGPGSPATRSQTLGRIGTAEVGLWEIDPGETVDTEADEIFIVLSGRGFVTFADGSRLELGPGVVVHTQQGDQTHWTIHERLRKVYVVRDKAADHPREATQS